jgi:hypothetical protein
MKWLLFLFLSLPALASPREEAGKLLEKYRSVTPVDLRMEKLSSEFIGLPYGFGGPLGEGPSGRYDQDPLYRFDTFDCTTFVETVTSLALSGNVEEFEKMMNTIRYENGEISYLKRNHFPSLEWIPNNIKNGIYHEINDLILPRSEFGLAEALIDLPNWLRKLPLETIQLISATSSERQNRLNELHGMASQYSAITARLDYLPINRLLSEPELLKRIPNGTAVAFVRPNWDLTATAGIHMNVSHQGLIFQTPAGPIMRHATSAEPKKVTESDLLSYLKKLKDHPTLKGIHLLQTVSRIQN